MKQRNVNFKNIVYDDKYYLIRLVINNEEALIDKDETYGEQKSLQKKESVVLYYLYGNDRTNSEKIINALKHAIKLCGGKGEAF